MIKYDKLWDTMKKKGFTTYDLYTRYDVNQRIIYKLKHGMNVNVSTIDNLCRILHCDVGEIMEHIED